jgi:hypothetical protein
MKAQPGQSLLQSCVLGFVRVIVRKRRVNEAMHVRITRDFKRQ